MRRAYHGPGSGQGSQVTYRTPQDAIRAGEVIAVNLPYIRDILVVAAVMRPDGYMVWADGNAIFWIVTPPLYHLVGAEAWIRWRRDHPDHDMQRVLEEWEEREQRLLQEERPPQGPGGR